MPHRPPFVVARLCFWCAAGLLIVTSAWWGVEASMPFLTRALAVGAAGAVVSVALMPVLSWIKDAQAAHHQLEKATPGTLASTGASEISAASSKALPQASDTAFAPSPGAGASKPKSEQKSSEDERSRSKAAFPTYVFHRLDAQGSFTKVGAVWVEEPEYAPGKHYTFQEYKEDDAFVYMQDKTRLKSDDRSKWMIVRLPKNGGGAEWSYNDPVDWMVMMSVGPLTPSAEAK